MSFMMFLGIWYQETWEKVWQVIFFATALVNQKVFCHLPLPSSPSVSCLLIKIYIKIIIFPEQMLHQAAKVSISSSSEFLFNYIGPCKRATQKGEFTTSSGWMGQALIFFLAGFCRFENILERKFDGSRTLLALTNSSYAWLRNKSSSIKIKVHVRVCLFLVNFLRSFDVWVWSGLWRRRFLMALCLDVCSLHRTSCHSKEASILRETSRHFSQKKERRRRHCSPPEILSMLWSGEVLFLHCFPHNFYDILVYLVLGQPRNSHEL